jgi:hypothetical protein
MLLPTLEAYQKAVDKQPVEPRDRWPKSRTNFKVLDFVNKAEIFLG